MKILYIDHFFHKKTNSADFLKEILKERFVLDELYLDPDEDYEKQISVANIEKEYPIIVLFQMMVDMKILKKFISFNSCVFFPMLDGSPDVNSDKWLQYSDSLIICFSKFLFDRLKSRHFNVRYIQYFPKPYFSEMDERFLGGRIFGFLLE